MTPLYVITAANVLLIGALPYIFFRRDGEKNFRWWLTAAPFFTAGGLVVAAFLGGIEGHYLPFSNATQWHTALGGLLSLLSVGLIAFTMGSHRIPLALWHQTNDAPQELVTWGAYARIRHPFYTAFLICLVGLGVACPHPLTIGCFLVALFGLNVTAGREERQLVASDLGAAYQRYMEGTGRFLPKL